MTKPVRFSASSRYTKACRELLGRGVEYEGTAWIVEQVSGSHVALRPATSSGRPDHYSGRSGIVLPCKLLIDSLGGVPNRRPGSAVSLPRGGGKRRSAKPNPPWLMPGERITGEVTTDGGIHRRVTPRLYGPVPPHLQPPTESLVELEAKRRRALGQGGKARHTKATAELFYAREDPKGRWKHLMAISDGKLVLFEMEPALLVGWNCKRTTVQGSDDWGGMSAAGIVAFKQSSGDKLLRPATAGEIEWMRSKLSATGGGKKRHAATKPRKATKRRRAAAAPRKPSNLGRLVAEINRMVR